MYLKRKFCLNDRLNHSSKNEQTNGPSEYFFFFFLRVNANTLDCYSFPAAFIAARVTAERWSDKSISGRSYRGSGGGFTLFLLPSTYLSDFRDKTRVRPGRSFLFYKPETLRAPSVLRDPPARKSSRLDLR